MIYKTLSRYEFVQEFEEMGRKDQFTPRALAALFAYLEELSDDIGEPFVLDVIGVCCEFSEEPATDDVVQATVENSAWHEVIEQPDGTETILFANY